LSILPEQHFYKEILKTSFGQLTTPDTGEYNKNSRFFGENPDFVCMAEHADGSGYEEKNQMAGSRIVVGYFYIDDRGNRLSFLSERRRK